MIRPPKLLEAALEYAARGWHVIPIWWIQNGDCACPFDSRTRGDDGVCDRPGKHPIAQHGVHDATVDLSVITDTWREYPRANVAIATGAASGLVVVDVDPRNGGNDTLDALELQLGRLPDTTAADTGGGGQHLFFRYPVGPGGEAIDLQAKLGPGVELQRDGQYVVAVPSGHLSGGHYGWRGECAPDEIAPADLPDAWVAALARPDDASDGEAPPCDIPLERREERARRYVAKMPTAISGEGGHGRTFAVACAIVRGFQLPRDSARKILEEYNTRCRPPWKPRELEHKLEQAATRARISWGYLLREAPPAAAPAAVADQPVGELPERLELTDTGNAIRFVRRYRGQLVWCDDRRVWRAWDGRRWANNAESTALELSKAIPREILAESASIVDDAKRKKTVQHAMASESLRARKAMLALAAVERGMLVPTQSQFDRDPWLLNVQNGTVDLRTGLLRPHVSTDWLTQLAPVLYDPRATCPRWLQFLDEVFGGSQELVDFLHRLVGYSVSGDTSVHGLYVLWGSGSNGKSTLIATLLAMLGTDYAKSLQPELLLAGAMKDSSAQEQIADLAGCRLAAMQETDRRKKLAEATVKALTSSDEIVAVRKFEHTFRFRPTHKAWFATNHRPEISGSDHGIWRRIYLIPFTQTFTGPQMDPTLPGQLLAELPGILTWAVQGCLEYRRRGSLEPPEEVQRATQEYQREEDLVGRFLEECCCFEPGASTAVGDLTKAFADWLEEAGERRRRTSDLWDALTQRGCERTRRGSGKMGTQQRAWSGVALTSGPLPTYGDDDRYGDAYAGL